MTIIDFNNARPQGPPQRELNADTINERLNAQAEGFINWLFGGRALIKNGEARVGDVIGTPGASLHVTLTGAKRGTWFDHATKEGGDLIALFRAWRGYAGNADFVLSLQEIAKDFLGDPIEVALPPWRAKPVEIIEQRKTELGSKPHDDMLELGAPVATYKYFDTHGNILASVVRYEPDGTRKGKTFRPYCFRTIEGQTKWRAGAPDLRPLYRLPSIAVTRAVVLTEGEGKADALAKLGIQATSAMQGANAPVDATDWSPLTGKDVTIWPDNDAVGHAYAAAAATKLAQIGCQVRVVQVPPGKTEGWDAADCITDGDDPRELLAQATEQKAVSSAATLEKYFKVRSAGPYDLTKAPLMAWVVPGLLVKRKVTMLVAPAGIGKSMLSLSLSIMVALRFPWAGWHPYSAEKVLVINAEDDYDDQMKRLTVAAAEMGVNPQEYAGRIMLADEMSSLVAAHYDSKLDMVVQTPLIDALVAYMIENGIGVLVVDPFAETFEGKENSNDHLKQAAFIWREVARRANAAVLLIHHTKKGSGDMAGNADASRGGGALIAAVRVLKTLFEMTAAEAERMGIEEEERLRYGRLDDAKQNHSAPGGHPHWFEKKSVDIGNGVDDRPSDNVGVMVPWKPPGLMDGVPRDEIREVLDSIQRGILGPQNEPTGQFYTRHTTSKDKGRWVGNLLMEALDDCDEAKAKGIIKEWLKNKVLEEFKYTDKGQRKPRKAIRCGPVADEM
jgi:hypothetical protein